MKKAIQTTQAPPTVGPYSQAVVANNFIFISGQIPQDNEGNLVEGDIRDKTKQCLENIKAILNEAGFEMDSLVKVTIFVTNLDDFAAINEVYAQYFKSIPPARSFVEVSRLPKGVPIEIEGIAIY
jgi:2-iminobutanoate/2-iminopropanoate deaminase